MERELRFPWFSITLRFDDEQYRNIIEKLDRLLAQSSEEQKAEFKKLTQELKSHTEKLAGSVAQNPQETK